MKLSIIGGTGPQGKGLALRFAKAGFEVALGSRDESRAIEVANSLSSKKYNAINLQLVLPGEKIDLNTLKISLNSNSRNQLLSNRKEEIIKYREKYINKLQKAASIKTKPGSSQRELTIKPRE